MATGLCVFSAGLSVFSLWQSAAHKAFEDMLLAAASIVFIDGHDYPNGSTRMAGILGGQYQCRGNLDN